MGNRGRSGGTSLRLKGSGSGEGKREPGSDFHVRSTGERDGHYRKKKSPEGNSERTDRTTQSMGRVRRKKVFEDV